VPDDGILSVDEDTSKNQEFARSNQDTKNLDAPSIAVDGEQNDSETDVETEAEENTPLVAVSSEHESVSRSPSRKRLPGRNVLAKTPKRISSMWKKGQKKDTFVIQSEDPVEKDVISTAGNTDDVSHLEISDESDSVHESKDIETKTTEETIKSVPDDVTLSVDKDTSKKHQPVPESPSSVIDIILGMTEMELLASASQDISSDRSNRAVESGQPKPFVFGASTDDCGVVTASTQEESAPQTKKASETAPISPPKIRSRLFPFRKRSNNTEVMEDTIVEESEEASEKDNDIAKIFEDEAAMLVDKAAALLKKRSSESLSSEQAMPESTFNGMVEENSNSVMDVILEKNHKTATDPSPDRPVADLKISVLQQSGPMVSTDMAKFDEGTFEETQKVIDISTGPLPWMQIVPDEGTADHGDGELEESSIDQGEGEEEMDEENEAKATKRKKRKKYLWKRRKSKSTESRVEPVVAETDEKEEGLVVPKDDLSDDESFAPKSTNEDNNEAYTGPMPWEAVANEAVEAAISASEWVGSALGIIDGEETPDDLPNIANKDINATERDVEKPKANKGRLLHIRSFGRIASSSSAAKGLPSEEGIPLEDGIKRSTSRSFPRNPVEITRTTGSSATQKRDNRGLERIFTVRRNRSKDSAPSDTSVDGSMEPLLIDDEEKHVPAKMKRKKTKIKLHRKRYTNLEDDESKKQVDDESPERPIVTPPNCYDCSSCLKGASSS
jgi:hypothetical protein